MKTTLAARLGTLTNAAAAALSPGAVRDQVTAIGSRLAEPTLRVAVGGRMNAGKSTLVNALLGQRLAPTGGTETTRTVTWFRYHHQNRVRIFPREGAPLEIPAAPGGGLPATLPVPAGTIASVVVEVSNERLAERYSLVDTPGLGSLSGLDATALAALADADALLYVMPHPGEQDRAALESVRTAAAAAGLTAANVLGVLSRVDTLAGDDPDPWLTAHRMARRYTEELRGLVTDIVPVIGLLAETARGDEFTERDAQLIAALAAADPDDVADALYAADTFRAWDAGPLRPAERARLLTLLDVYGLRTAVALVEGGTRGSGPLLAGLAARSGIDALAARLDEHFVRSADRLRAMAALTSLDRLSWSGETTPDKQILARLRAGLAGIRQDPALRQLVLLPALTELTSCKLTLDVDDAAALVALATGASPALRLGLEPEAPSAVIRAAIPAEVARWRTLEGNPTRLIARRARSARELCEAMLFTDES